MEIKVSLNLLLKAILPCSSGRGSLNLTQFTARGGNIPYIWSSYAFSQARIKQDPNYINLIKCLLDVFRDISSPQFSWGYTFASGAEWITYTSWKVYKFGITQCQAPKRLADVHSNPNKLWQAPRCLRWCAATDPALALSAASAAVKNSNKTWTWLVLSNCFVINILYTFKHHIKILFHYTRRD